MNKTANQDIDIFILSNYKKDITLTDGTIKLGYYQNNHPFSEECTTTLSDINYKKLLSTEDVIYGMECFDISKCYFITSKISENI